VVDSVVVRVVDHGRGVPPEMLEEVFTRFRQVEVSDACGGKGTGLGLAICRSIIDGHHGRIWMESTPGGGATCVFTLPLHSIPMPSIALPVAPEGARRSTADSRQSILGQEVAWQHVA
jgi:signal transduction histidine kinase